MLGVGMAGITYGVLTKSDSSLMSGMLLSSGSLIFRAFNRISLEKLKDVDFNIKVGCMIFQSDLKEMEDNVIAAIQSYNMGTGSVKKIIVTYATASGKTYDAIISNPDDTGWLDYRTSSFPGDPDYVENVTRYYPSNGIKK